MYSERHPIMFPGGLHNVSLTDMMTLGLHNHGLTIDGTPLTPETYDNFVGDYGDQPEREIEIGAHSGDPQRDRDVVHIAKHVIQKGQSPWPNAPGAIPPQALNGAANAVRQKEGLPVEQIQAPVQQMTASDDEEKDEKWEHVEHPGEDGEEDEGWYPDWKGPDHDAQTEPMGDPTDPRKKGSSVKTASAPEWFLAALAPIFGGAGLAANMATLWQQYVERYGDNPSMLQTFLQTVKSLAPSARGEHDDGSFYDDNTTQLRNRMTGATNEDTPPAVKGEMSDQTVEAKWHVVALGEKQQPGGVGATQDDYNPVTDGANPNGPNFIDNAGNSREQEQALETWVNLAIDMLNRGELEDAVIAQLAHDGCPDPQAVLQRALQQDMEQPVSNEAGTDAFDMPVNQEPLGANDSVTQPPQDVYASVSEGDYIRVKRTGQRGRIVASFLDVWGDGVYKIALDSGRLVDLTPKQIVAINEIETPADPLGEIQSWLDGFDPADDGTRASVEARISNLEKASLALHDARLARGMSFSDQIRADKMKSEVDYELSGLRIARRKLEESDFEYLDSLPKFTHNAFAIFEGEKVVNHAWTQRVAEDAAILVSELPVEMLTDAPGVELAAVHHAAGNYASDEATDAFLSEVERLRVARVSAGLSTHTASTDDAFTPNDGPAEELFW